MKLTKIEKVLVNASAGTRNIKVTEKLFSQIDLTNVKKTLEIGCGVGVLSSYLAEKYKWEVTGIDLDSEQIEKARRNYEENKYLRFIKANAIELPFENNEFDLVSSFDVLHHILNWNKAIKEINRVLKPEGFYIFNDLAFPQLKIFEDLLKKYMSIYAIEDITDYSERNNFKVIYEKELKIINIPTCRFSIILQKNKSAFISSPCERED